MNIATLIKNTQMIDIIKVDDSYKDKVIFTYTYAGQKGEVHLPNYQVRTQDNFTMALYVVEQILKSHEK